MRVVLFDSILEDHTCRGLKRALELLGHDVVWTGRVWHGHRFPTKPSDLETIRRRLRAVLTPRPDLFFNFRASALPRELIHELRPLVGTMAVWLPDDPMLYGICYRHVVDDYDLILHTGNERILEFYESRHGRSGVNFPFWTDSGHLRYAYDPTKATEDAIFLGHCSGHVRRERYAQLAALRMRVRILGKVDEDPAGMQRTFLGDALYEPRTLRRELSKGRIGLTIPQYFRHYAGHAYDFPELAGLGHYDMPSRVVRYAAVGLPVAALGQEQPPLGFPEVITAQDPETLSSVLRPILSDPPALLDLSQRTRSRATQSFSALSRARFLVALQSDPRRWDGIPVREKAVAFAGFAGENEPPPAPRLSTRLRGRLARSS